jgi:predicted DNA-binding transcriptional regulator AlpA
MTTTNNTTQEDARMEPLVDVNVLHEKYGPPVTWWYSAAERGEVPSFKLGKYRKFRISEVEAWLQSRRSGSTSEPR